MAFSRVTGKSKFVQPGSSPSHTGIGNKTIVVEKQKTDSDIPENVSVLHSQIIAPMSAFAAVKYS